MATVYEKIPAPGFSTGPDYRQDEILYSYTGRFTQKGCTIAGGQGVLPAGTLLGQKTADKLYYAFAPGAGDGTETAVGVLRTAVDTGTGAGQPNQQGNIVISGILRLDKVGVTVAGVFNSITAVPYNSALTDLGGTALSVNNTLKL